MGEQRRLRLAVSGMDCGSCVAKIETAVRRLPHVEAVDVSLQRQAVTVSFAERAAGDAETARRTIEKLGFQVAPLAVQAEAAEEVHSHDDGHGHDHGPLILDRPWWRTPKAYYVFAAAILVGIAALVAWRWPEVTEWAFGTAALIALMPVARRALAAAVSGQVFTIEMLMTIAAVGALFIDAAEEAALVVLLFAVGELLETVAATRARQGIAALADLRPKTALLLEGETTREVPADSLQPGQRVLVRPGDRVPGDGAILEGSGALDESAVTGESVPRNKAAGDEVFAGTIAVDGALRVEITRAAEDNTIARILKLVEEAQESRAPVQRFIDRFARIYMPIVVLVALLVAVLPPLLAGESWDVWIYRALALLLIACPCALVISTPAAMAAGLAVAARRGLLMKGGAVLERLGRLKIIAFDKTGTLTSGQPQVTEVLAGSEDEAEALRLSAALESGSSHPIARAILARAAAEGMTLPQAGEVKALAGKGLTGVVEGRNLSLVSPRAAHDALRALPALAVQIEALESDGKTVSVLCEDGRVLGAVAVRDEPRTDSRVALGQLAAMGVGGIMLTGDNARTGAAVARDLGIEARAELLPEDKARIIGELQAAGRGPVGKVGDGINDAPALARADVGIAMGAGTDVALETADAALLTNRIGGVVELIALSRATLRNVHANIIIALGSKAVFLVTTVLGITGMWIAVLADTGATVLVTLNALRLLRFRFQR